jgi:hypothetical protein
MESRHTLMMIPIARSDADATSRDWMQTSPPTRTKRALMIVAGILVAKRLAIRSTYASACRGTRIEGVELSTPPHVASRD